MANFTILPIRFLTIFNGKEDVLAMMEEYYKDFRENLDNLHNKVEFSIKVIWPADKIRQRIIDAYNNNKYDAPILPDSPAKNFIKDKLEKYKIDKEFEEEADRCINIIESFFNRFASEKKLEKLKSENLLLNASYLVEKEKESDFKKAFEQMKNDPGDLKYLFSGPWPPYNFVVLTKHPQPFRNISEVDIFDRILQRQNLTDKEAI